MSGFDASALRRWPDVESPELKAYDGADLLLLETAADRGLIPGSRNSVVVVNDHYGALTLGAIAHGAPGLRVHQDALSGERAVDANAARRNGTAGQYVHVTLTPELFTGAGLVLLQLPRSLDALEEIADLVARHAHPDVVVLAGGRVKHMTLAMNSVLERYFGSVTASRAGHKSRVLTATGPRALEILPAPRFPLASQHDVGLARPLQLRAFASTFGGAKLDPGTRFLLPHLEGAHSSETAVDLGCGNGTIATYLALMRPALQVEACDQSASAVASTRATGLANGVQDRLQCVRDDALHALPDSSRHFIVLNPPFHVGNAVHAGIALKLMADAGRVLAPGGELWCVWNSHLAYRSHLARLVGPTRQVARNPKFTVTVSTKR